MSDAANRIRAGIDWGRSGPWPPDAVTALDELLAENERLQRITLLTDYEEWLEARCARLEAALREIADGGYGDAHVKACEALAAEVEG